MKKGGYTSSSLKSLFGGNQQQEKQQQERKKRFSSLHSEPYDTVSEAFNMVLDKMDFLGLKEEGTKFQSHIKTDEDKLYFIQDVGYDYDGQRLYLPNPKQKQQKQQKQHPTKFDVADPLRKRKLYLYMLDIWKNLEESYVNFIRETQGLWENVDEQLKEYLLTHFSYAWESYYDVGPWTKITFSKLTKADKRECRLQILMNMNDNLNDLYFPTQEISKDSIKNTVLRLYILQKLFLNIPLRIIDRGEGHGEGAEGGGGGGKSKVEGGGAQGGGGIVVGRVHRIRASKIHPLQNFQQVDVRDARKIENEVQNFGTIRDLLEQFRVAHISQQVLQRQLQRNMKFDNNEYFVQLFLVLLREFDLCQELEMQFVMLQWIVHLNDIYKVILEQKKEFKEFKEFIEPWVEERIELRHQHLDCDFSLFFDILERENDDGSKMYFLLRMRQKEMNRLWKCFLFREIGNGKERLDISALFLENIYSAFYHSTQELEESYRHGQLTIPEVNIKKGLLADRLNQLSEFLQHNQMELFPKNEQRRNTGCGGVGGQGGKVVKVGLTKENLTPFLQQCTTVQGWGKYQNFFQELMESLLKGPVEKSESDMLRLLYVFIFTKFAKAEDKTFYYGLVFSDFVKKLVHHFFPSNLTCQQQIRV